MKKINIKIQIGDVEVLVDSEDYDFVNQWKWRIDKVHNRVVRTDHLAKPKRTIQLHRAIMARYYNIQGKQIDHKNHNRFDNQKSNLRVCSNSENGANRRLSKHNKSGYIGVRKQKAHPNLWMAQATFNGVCYYLGYYKDADVAASVRDAFVSILHGEFAYFNFEEFIK